MLTKKSSEDCCSQDRQLTYTRSATPKIAQSVPDPFPRERAGSGIETNMPVSLQFPTDSPMATIRTVCQGGQWVHEVNVRSVCIPLGHLPQRNPEITYTQKDWSKLAYIWSWRSPVLLSLHCASGSSYWKRQPERFPARVQF